MFVSFISSIASIPPLCPASPAAFSTIASGVLVYRANIKLSRTVYLVRTTASLSAMPAAAYESLTGLLREVSSLNGVAGILSFDEQTVMAEGSSRARGQQKAALAGVIHEKSSSPTLEAAIVACEATEVLAFLSDFEKAVVRDARRDFAHTVRVSKEFSSKMAAAETASVAVWAAARKNNDWVSFAPHLKTMLELAKEYAITTRPDMDPYDAAVDQYERGMTAARLKEIFSEIEEPLKGLLERVAVAAKTSDPVMDCLKGSEKWNVTSQAALCKIIAEKMTFDFNCGVLAVSTHPFTGGANGDVRITSRYSTTNPWEGIMGTTHEVGHGLFEQGLNPEYEGLPVAQPLSMGAHESQVRHDSFASLRLY
jgi:carboxypeptidase Taq